MIVLVKKITVKDVESRLNTLSLERKSLISIYEQLTKNSVIFGSQRTIFKCLDDLNMNKKESAHWITQLFYHSYDTEKYIFEDWRESNEAINLNIRENRI